MLVSIIQFNVNQWRCTLSTIIEYYCQSNIGKYRKINQDNYLCGNNHLTADNRNVPSYVSGTVNSEAGLVLAVFDGMGGEECGETASLIASEEALKTDLNQSEDTLVILNELCMRANKKICDFADANNVNSTGTTAAILGFTRKGVSLCNVGDSKIFRYANGTLKQISVDHVGIPPMPNMKAPLSQNLGIPEDEMVIEPYFAKGEYTDGDMYLICSDGLTDMVEDFYIEDVLKRYPMNQAVNTLVDMALENGGRDNITIILCKIHKEKKSFLSDLFGD